MAKKRNRPSKPLASPEPRSPYVTRGGEKLRGALDAFQLSPLGRVCLDIGASHGGFTDCLLQAGAAKVYAIDVGYGLLDFKLRNDPRVTFWERTNVRFFDMSLLPEPPTLVTVDVSFISLTTIFPKIAKALRPGGDVVALVKPQFEGTPKEVPGGFVKNEATRQDIVARTRAALEQQGAVVRAVSDSAVAGRKGNQETFFHLTL